MGPPLKINCAACQKTMIEGFLLDRASGQNLTGEWIEGPPDLKSFWKPGTNIKGRKHFPIRAMRCPNCGKVELYALNDDA
jgi:hypothetical protein